MVTYNKRNRRLYYDKAIELYFEKNYCIAEISRLFSVGESTISYWISTFAKEKSNKNTNAMAVKKVKKASSSVIKQPTDGHKSYDDMDAVALRRELALMKKKLADAELKADLYNEIINVAESKFNISIRKKAGTKQ